MSVGAAPTASSPIEDVEALLHRLGLAADGLATMRSSHGNRIILGVAARNALAAVVKLGAADDEGMRIEEEVLRRLPESVGVLAPPTLLWAGSWNQWYVVATRAVSADRRPWALTPDEACDICISLSTHARDVGPIVHGDLAPWNILPLGTRYVVVDWEFARFEDDPLYDFAHFLVQQGGFIHRYAPEQIVRLLLAPASPGWRYLEAVGRDPAQAPGFLDSYLKRSGWVAGLPGFRYRLEVGKQLERWLAKG